MFQTGTFVCAVLSAVLATYVMFYAHTLSSTSDQSIRSASTGIQTRVIESDSSSSDGEDFSSPSPRPGETPRPEKLSPQSQFVHEATPIALMAFRLFLLSAIFSALSMATIGWTYYPSSPMRYFSCAAGLTLLAIILIASRIVYSTFLRIHMSPEPEAAREREGNSVLGFPVSPPP